MTTAPEYIGIDVAKATLAVGSSSRWLGEFPNTPAGFKAIITLLSSLTVAGVVLEATGVYGQDFIEACMLAGYQVAVVQPGRVRHFAKSQNLHAKTDAIDAQLIARYAESGELRFLEKTPKKIAQLRALIDRREQLILMRVSEENHLEANRNDSVRKEITASIARLKEQEKQYTKKIKALIDADEQLAIKRELLEKEAGVGAQTSAVLIANLPELGTINRQQVAALAGLAPYNNDSGTIRGKRSIYGGRKRLRKALYLAALSAVKWSEWLRTAYAVLRKKGKCAKVALIACARKLIIRLNSLLAAANKKAQETKQPA